MQHAFACVLIVSVAAYWLYHRVKLSSSDPYGLFHLSLNKLPGEDESSPPKTEWLNMGYWRDTNSFPDALPSTALALKLVQAAQCKEKGKVLDVGHGTGESLILLLTHPSVPRPAYLAGITSIPLHHKRSLQRIQRIAVPNTDVSLHVGDAIFRKSSSVNHPFSPSTTSFDTILALDCAHHFRTREEFLRQSFHHLERGGRIALADVCLANTPPMDWKSRVTRQVLRLLPKENAVSVNQYAKCMEEIGYENVVIEDISADVFPGFVGFLKPRGFGRWISGTVFYAYYMSGARLFWISQNAPFPRSLMTAIQSVHISGYQERLEPKAHTVYQIDVRAHVRSWSIWRRYSEFDDLHIELVKGIGSPPPAPLPPKHKYSILRSHNDPALLEERKTGLEAYLRAIISAKEDKWREAYAFKEFLGVPVGRQAGIVGGPPTQFTLTSWLEEYQELQNRLRDVRADINKREALSDQGDVNASHKSNVSAKQKLAGVLSRVGTLGNGLRELAMSGVSEGELQRRTDMVARLQDDCEKLGKMVTVARQANRSNTVPSAPFSAASMNPPSTSDREALLGPTNTFTRVTRVFGQPSKPQETDMTRPLDNVGLFGLQQGQIQQQDDQLAQLTTILSRQKQLGNAINAEIGEQITMLDGLSNDVDRVGDKLSKTSRQMHRLG
ncbi:hypothetical protein GYMLUDRAFT_254342 [Collybiopsis luxurians FD-317 M1]|nr:hypothetical protein GYMLUDRAFT_254342 [Collybiopsis luxurians FD-317 M1]